ncbi:hypothetical protein P618_200650 [Holospora obtusa F1]|uniref:Uncharacterized protein n=1 Tax=Holospora obtusa F1 TaxID=1399147 RepID=W6TDL6_HOLOB|nr:hypothetical protein [Holospora obtusa]ETZ07168.1 hypothetical protein P618_200650 [Holospora obtusa F1]
MLEYNFFNQGLKKETQLILYKKSLLGMGVSITCLGIGIYINHWVSLAYKKTDSLNQEALQENYIKTTFLKKKIDST